MEKPSFKLVGAPCGHHGQYTFYKAIRLTGEREKIVAIGDFFFVRIWQDSELVSIGELQLLWTDRVSDQTLVSLRLYFLPENTPDGRNLHGEDEVLAINDKVVLRAEDLLSWVCDGEDWRWGLRAVWRGACTPPADSRHTAALHHTKLDFSDVEKEKSAIDVDVESPGVVVFSYPRYCRYRALLSRLDGIQADWLRDSLVAALGGYAAPTKNTRILYCKETFEYPELEGHEFVCNHLAPRLKGRPRGRRRRAHHSPDSRSSDDGSAHGDHPPTPRRLSLRNGLEKRSTDLDPDRDPNVTEDDKLFLKQLKHFYKENDVSFAQATSLKQLSLRALYASVTSRGGYEAVCRHRLWRVMFAEQPAYTRRHYERYLLPFEKYDRRRAARQNGVVEAADTIDVCDSPQPSPNKHVDNETGEIKEEINITCKPAEELNREFLASLPKDEKPLKITVKPVETLVQARDEVDAKPHLPVSSAPAPLNGHAPLAELARPAGRSSLRAVRVKPARAHPLSAPPTPPVAAVRPEPSSSSPASLAPVTNFGIHHPPPITNNNNSDDEIIEVPYKPKTPEIIDLDEYPESPQAVKKKKLDILKERGLEVTALPAAWPPAVQHHLLAGAQLFQMYNIVPPAYNGIQPPKVIQATPLFGTTSPEKTVYGNPKDPFMPPPHLLLGTPIKPARSVQTPVTPPQDILDLTCKLNSKPAVEIVRVPTVPSPTRPQPQNLVKNYSIVDGKAVVGSNLEITLVNKAQSSPKKVTQKRSSNGKFTKTPTPPKDYSRPVKTPAIVVPNYQIPREDSPSSTSSQNNQKPPEAPKGPMTSFLDPYMALYNLAGQMDPRQLAAYREIMANSFRYSSILNMGVGNPTTKQ